MAAVYDGKSERSINNGLDRIDAQPVYEVPFVYPLSVYVRMKFGRISYTVDTGDSFRHGHRIIYRSIFPALETSFDVVVTTRYIPHSTKIYHENDPRNRGCSRFHDTSLFSLSLSLIDFHRVEKSVEFSATREFFRPRASSRWRSNR